MSRLTETFPLVLHETASLWRNLLNKRLKPLGLSQAKWRALLHLSLAENPLTQTELAARLGIEGASLVSLLDSMTSAGWVKRQNMPHDRRSKIIKLTEKAQIMLIDIHATANELRKELLVVVSEHELKMCKQVLQKIKARAQELT